MSISLLSIGHGCVDVYQGAVAALVPFFVAERDYTYAGVAGLMLAASLLSSVAQPVFGWLTDRFSMPWLIPTSTVLAGLGIGASGVIGGYVPTLLVVALAGLGVAAYHPESARVARIASRGSHTAMSWFSLGGKLGFAAAPILVVGVVATEGLDGTPLLALPALLGALLCLPVLRAMARPRDAMSAESSPPAAPDDVPAFVRLSLAVVCRSIVFVGLSTFISLYAAERTGGGAAAGALALFLMFAGGAVGTLLGGSLAQRWGRTRVTRWAYLVAVASVAGVVLVPGPALYACVVATSIALYVPFSLQVTLAQDYLPSRVGTASGITLGLTISIGGLATPVIGAIADATSLQTALLPVIGMPLLAWWLVRTLPEPAVSFQTTANRDRPEDEAGDAA